MTTAVAVDIQKLTLRQIMEVEGIVGKSMTKAFNDMDAKTLAVFAYVCVKKTDPNITLEEVYDWPVSAITVMDGTEADPKALATADGA